MYSQLLLFISIQRLWYTELSFLFNFYLQVMEQIEENHIDIYKFPECDSDEDEEFKQQDRELKVSLTKVIDQGHHFKPVI